MKCGNRPFGNSRLKNSFIVNSKLSDEFFGLGGTGLIANASFRISLLFACLSICQDQVTCTQPDVLDRAYRHAIIK